MEKPTVSEFFRALREAEADGCDIDDQWEFGYHVCVNYPKVDAMVSHIDSITYASLIDTYRACVAD